MIYVTERAKEELKRLLAASVDWPGARLRIMDRGEGKLGLGVDIEAQDDQVIDYEGIKLLVVEPRIANSPEQVTIDVDDTPKGAEFVII